MTDQLVVPFLSLSPQHTELRAEILAALGRVYDSGWYVLGREVERFEAEYAAFNKVRHAVGVGNGLEAIVLSLRALGIGPGDEVLVPSNTYIATWLAVSQVGATVVPVEPDAATYNISPRQIEAAVTSRTKAIIPVHLYGQACEMPAIMAIAERHGLYVIEDNAQAQGAAFHGQLTGSFGHLNATSFYPTKNLGALGDGGAVTTNDEALVHRLRLLRNYGSAQKYHNEVVGYNSRLDEMQAAVLQIKLPHLAFWTRQRQQLAALYTQCLGDLPWLTLPAVAPGATHVYHLYVVRTPRRDALQRHLATHGIETLVHYPIAPHEQAAYAATAFDVSQTRLAGEIARTCLSLPLWPGMREEQVAYVGEVMRRFDG